MTEEGKLSENPRDLRDRCKRFAVRVILFVRKLPATPENREIGRQVIRSGGSIGANYIEAQYARTSSEFYSSVKISLREANESTWWLEILREINPQRFHAELNELLQESKELANIFASISLKNKKQK